MTIKSISTGVYCGRVMGLKSILVDTIARRSFFMNHYNYLSLTQALSLQGRGPMLNYVEGYNIVAKNRG